LESGTANGLRLALGQAAEKEFQVEGFLGVVMGDLLEEWAKRNLNGQFLMEFAHKAGLEALAWFTFTARELPQTRQVAALQALGDEKFLSVKNQAGSDVDGLNGQCSCR
jgi:hypothetical protein